MPRAFDIFDKVFAADHNYDLTLGTFQCAPDHFARTACTGWRVVVAWTAKKAVATGSSGAMTMLSTFGKSPLSWSFLHKSLPYSALLTLLT
jgi:hypothetical protein